MERLLDSVILIDHLNGIDKASRFILDLNPMQAAISVITRAEILSGLTEDNEKSVSILLDQYHILIIDKPIADLFSKITENASLETAGCFSSSIGFAPQNKINNPQYKRFQSPKT